MEVWKDIPLNPLYKVSNRGRIMNPRGKIMTLGISTSGYYRVALNLKYYYVHRLVASAFLDNIEDLPLVNHKDENKLNNDLSNLEWCTNKYNANYGTRNLRCAEAHNKKVKLFDREGNFVKEWDSYLEAERALNLRAGTISSYINSEFHWEAS